MGHNVHVDLDSGALLSELRRVNDAIEGGMGADWAGPAVAREVAAIEAEYFESNGGGKWPPLSAGTQAARAGRSGYYANAPAAGVTSAGPVLVWTGTLRESLTNPFGAGSINAIVEMHPDRVVVGTRVPWAKHHVNTRPPIKEFDNEDIERVSKVFERFLLEELGQ